MKYISSVLAAIAVMVALPASSIAATYAYVTVNGTLAHVEAATAAQALTIPTDRLERSGVILLSAAVQAHLNGTPVQATSTMPMPTPMVWAPVATTTATSTVTMPTSVVATTTATSTSSVQATSTATTTSTQ